MSHILGCSNFTLIDTSRLLIQRFDMHVIPLEDNWASSSSAYSKVDSNHCNVISLVTILSDTDEPIVRTERKISSYSTVSYLWELPIIFTYLLWFCTLLWHNKPSFFASHPVCVIFHSKIYVIYVMLQSIYMEFFARSYY